MTFLSRRKRPITPRSNTRPATARCEPAAAIALLTLWAWAALAAGPGRLAAAEPADAGGVQPASYTTSARGATLKWSAQRPDVIHDDQVLAVQHQEPFTQEPLTQAPLAQAPLVQPPLTPAAALPGEDAFADPFQDGRGGAARPRGRMRQVSSPGITAGDALNNDRLLDFPGPNGRTNSAPLTAPRQMASAASPSPSAPSPGAGGAEPSIEQRMAAGRMSRKETCLTPEELGRTHPFNKITYDIKPKMVGEYQVPPECGMGNPAFQPRCFGETTYTWTASSLCHKPLYFDENQLERYGHCWRGEIQPILSAGHFFACIPLLPYNMGLEPPGECVYSLGYCRPGSCAPYTLDPLPFSVRAAAAEAGVATGLVFLLP